MDNADIEAGTEEEFRGQRGCKYHPVVDDDCAVLEMSSMDPSSSSSSSLSSLPVHQASLKKIKVSTQENMGSNHNYLNIQK
ncbi:hypothetical protein ACFX15_013542 [Malus domestica]